MTEANVKVAQHYDALPNWNQNYDTAAMLTLLTKGFGCSSCQPKANAPSGSRLTYYSYITSPGYDGIPPYEAFLNKSVMLQYKCSTTKQKLQMNTNEIMGVQMFHTYINGIGDTYAELPCYRKILNCAICGGLEHSKCKMCFDGYAL